MINLLLKMFHNMEQQFKEGGKYEKFFYAFEAGYTFIFTPKETTPPKGTQIRDAIDLKRLMMTVVIAMVPCLNLIKKPGQVDQDFFRFALDVCRYLAHA